MAKKASILFGIIFVIVGILGFISNPIVGSGSLFEADTVHNLIHLIIGIILLVMAKKPSAGTTLAVVGVVYLVLAIVGFFVAEGSSPVQLLGIASINSADNWLHLVLGIVIAGVGFKARKESSVPMQ
jgi:uncharacterized membrane protein